MIVGTAEWDEVNIDFKYAGAREVDDSYIVVHLSFPVIQELMQVRPDWFVDVFLDKKIYAFPIEYYRAARLWAQRPEWAELKIHDFIERVVSGAPPVDRLRSNDDPA